MAAVDQVHLIFHQISKSFQLYQEGLALFGAYVVLKRTISLCLGFGEALKVFVLPRLGWNVDLKNFGPWAIVTGSTDGIGRAYAQELARQGLNIILISRSSDKLKRAAKDIETAFGVKTKVIKADFGLGEEIYSEISRELGDLKIGLLVNNVGAMDIPEYFHNVPHERLWQLININIGAATMMTSIVLPQMLERNKGAIVNISASASIYPNPQLAVYTACKTYLDYFSRALQYEYRHSGIIVQSLIPSYVATKMTQLGMKARRNSLLMPSAAEFAKHAVASLGASSRTTGYWPHSIQLWIAKRIPERYWMWGQNALNSALRRQVLTRRRHRSGQNLAGLKKAASFPERGTP